MTVTQALACGILYWLAEANVPYVTVWTVQKPLVCGWVTGWILGCPQAGALCGALCSLMLIGYRSTGSSMPGDIGLAGICAAAAAAAGAPAGAALLLAFPGYFAGIAVWRLRLHVNRSFGERTEQLIRAGGRLRLLIPAVLEPAVFSALVCVPVGAAFSLAVSKLAFSIPWTAAAAAAGFRLMMSTGLLLPCFGLVLPLLRLREMESLMTFACGLLLMAACMSFAPGGLPLLVMAAAGLPACALAVRFLEKKKEKEAEADHAGGDPDFDPDFTDDAEIDPDLDPDWPKYGEIDPDLADSAENAAYLTESPGKAPGPAPDPGPTAAGWRKLSPLSLAAADLLWILFVQTAYNTKRMMGQAVAAAFLPVVEKMCPGDPKAQEEVLLRQCAYLNTQPELGSCVIGHMIAMEAQKAGADRIRNVRSVLMGIFGGIGDEFFQCGWIPALLLICADWTLRSGGKGIPAVTYILAAALSSGILSIVWFLTGLKADDVRLLGLLEGTRLQRVRRLMRIWLPFLLGGSLAAYFLRHIFIFAK